MRRAKEHSPKGAALAVLLTALWLGAAACSDAEGVASPLDASSIGSAQAGLSGTWSLHEKLSDRPDSKGPDGRPGFQPNRPDGRPEIGGNRPPGHPFDRDHRGMGPRGLPRTLEITQTDQSVTFAGPDGGSRTLYTDGRTETHELPNGDVIQVQAGWTDAALMIVRTGNRGTHTESFALSGDEQQLTVTVQIAPADQSDVRTFRLVYDRT